MRAGIAIATALSLGLVLMPTVATAGEEPVGPLSLIHEGTTTTADPGRSSQISYHDCEFFSQGEQLNLSLLGGGFSITNAAVGEAWAVTSRPFDGKDGNTRPEAWQVAVDNVTAETDITYSEAAACGEVGGVNYSHLRRPSLAGKRVAVKVECPTRQHVLGGGGAGSGPFGSQRLVATSPFDSGDDGHVPDDGWRVVVDNTSVDDHKATVYAICARLGGLSYVSRGGEALAGARGSKTVSCPKDKVTLGGGVSPQGGGFGKQRLMRSAFDFPGATWSAQVDNTGGKTLDFRVFAICHR
jgi:hypothetical protein